MLHQRPNLCAQVPLIEILEPRLLLTGEQIPVDYLIIAGDAFFSGGSPCEAIQELAEWKQMKGFRTWVTSTSHAESVDLGIPNYILHGALEEDGEWWSTPPQYVLLVGDAEQVPAQTSARTNSTPSEPVHFSDVPYANTYRENIYGNYGPDSHVPELAIGRIPVDNVTDLDIVIDKILAYDRNPYVPEGAEDNWYNNALVGSYFEDGAVPFFEGSSDGMEDAFYFMETAQRAADFLGGDYGYWDPNTVNYDPYDSGYTVNTALIATTPGLTGYSVLRRMA